MCGVLVRDFLSCVVKVGTVVLAYVPWPFPDHPRSVRLLGALGTHVDNWWCRGGWGWGCAFCKFVLSLSADNGLTAARFLVVGELVWLSLLSIRAPNISPHAWASESSGVGFLGDMGLCGSGCVVR